MTEISFSEFASEEWGQAAGTSAESGSGTGFLGIGVATAMAVTVAVAAWHHTSFLHSSWTPLVKQPIHIARKSALDAIAPRKTVTPLGAPALNAAVAPATDTPRTGRVVHQVRTAWLPEGMSSVEVTRSGRVSHSQQFASRAKTPAAGMADIRIGRSTRLALAEPALPSSLRHALKAAEPAAAPEPKLAAIPAPVPAPVPQLEAEKQIAELTPPLPLVTLPSDNIPLPMPATRPTPTLHKQAADTAPAVASTELPTRGPLPAPRPASHPGVAPKPASPRYQLAYASPDTVNNSNDSGGGFFGHLFGNHKSGLAGVGPRVAVYSIKDATVYMPNGQKLEAHSGTGHMTDNPRYTDRKMHGPTPPNVYNLTMRKHLFHGVRAVRMSPTNKNAMHGRDGMLAHTYMLRGRPGESNGCVVFKHYAKFLNAFSKGRVTRMIVVPTLDDLPRQVASR